MNGLWSVTIGKCLPSNSLPKVLYLCCAGDNFIKKNYIGVVSSSRVYCNTAPIAFSDASVATDNFASVWIYCNLVQFCNSSLVLSNTSFTSVVHCTFFF